jgi:hypothetical protein
MAGHQPIMIDPEKAELRAVHLAIEKLKREHPELWQKVLDASRRDLGLTS